MQRNFEPMRKQVGAWQRSELTDVTAKVVIYEAFVEANWKLPNTFPGQSMTSTSSRYAVQSVMQSIFSSAARLRVSVVAKKP
jgi:hypothetical protein